MPATRAVATRPLASVAPEATVSDASAPPVGATENATWLPAAGAPPHALTVAVMTDRLAPSAGSAPRLAVSDRFEQRSTRSSSPEARLLQRTGVEASSVPSSAVASPVTSRSVPAGTVTSRKLSARLPLGSPSDRLGSSAPVSSLRTFTSTVAAPDAKKSSACTSRSADSSSPDRSAGVHPSVSAGSAGHWLFRTSRSVMLVLSARVAAGEPSALSGIQAVANRSIFPSPLKSKRGNVLSVVGHTFASFRS